MIYTNQEIEEARNSKVKDRRVYKSRRINNFRELVSYSVEHYAEHIAYKYKNKPSDKEIIKRLMLKREWILKLLEQRC